jgi:hypothetical protein
MASRLAADKARWEPVIRLKSSMTGVMVANSLTCRTPT